MAEVSGALLLHWGARQQEAVARLVLEQISDGTLKPGAPVPPATVLAAEAGCGLQAARNALRRLVDHGILMRGASPQARLRVARPGDSGPGEEDLWVLLSRTLAARRRDRGMTQKELARELRVSETTIGHAETGRNWQSGLFWAHADAVVGGGLLYLYDRCMAARGFVAPAEVGWPVPVLPPPVLPASVTITPDGVAVVWPDGTETLARPPGRQDPEVSGAGPSPQPRPGAVPAQEGRTP